MIGDAITFLIYAHIVVAFIQPSAPRLYAAVLFTAVILLHEFLLSDLEGLQYYGSAALFDLLIIGLTSGINPVPRMVLSLHRTCIASILVNSVGWVLWFFYFPPLAYDATFVLLYAWTLITFIKRDGDHVGDYTLDSWTACFRFNLFSWSNYFNHNGGKV